MSELVADCPRCGANKMTFDLLNQVPTFIENRWKMHLEVFCVCRQCSKPTIFSVRQKEMEDGTAIKNGLSKLDFSANIIVEVERYISIQDTSVKKPPKYLPENIEAPFNEGSACYSIGCYNAAATMFRLCVDLSTREMLPNKTEGLNSSARRSLGLRLSWLFNSHILPEALKELSSCIKDDGNDGAHQGTLNKEDAADILDFTFLLLERFYTEPARIKKANERRAMRREN